MGLEAESLHEALLEVSSMQRLLPPRPTAEQYESALAAVARAGHLLESRLQDLAMAKRPESIPEEAFRALQEMREEILRMQVCEQKRPWLMVIELEERHQRYDRLLQRVQSSTSLVNGGSFGTSSTVLNGIESSSSGEFSEDSVRSNGRSLYSTHQPSLNLNSTSNSASLASLALETGRHFAAPRRAHEQGSTPQAYEQGRDFHPKVYEQGREVFQAGIPQAYEQGREVVLYPQGRDVFQAGNPQVYEEGREVYEQGREASVAPAPAPKVLSTIDEGAQEPHCPPKLVELFQAAADKDSESLSIVDTFFRESILLPDLILPQMTNLKFLELSGNRIVKLPEAIGELKQLSVLDVQSNQLTILPESLGRLTSLKKLNIEKNAIEELPWTIGNCSSLEELRADFNQLKALPEAVGYLTNLRILTVHLNCLKSLPTTMAYLTSLRELDVHFNQLESIPENLCHVTTLRRLDISSNFHALRRLPYQLGKLEQLVELDISYNSILELPDSIVRLENLQKLRLEGNPWRVPPMEIAQKGKEAVFEYMHERVKQKQEEKLARKKRSFVVKVVRACWGSLGSLCESKHGDSGLNILA